MSTANCVCNGRWHTAGSTRWCPSREGVMTDNRQRAAEVLGFREVEQANTYARDDLERIAAALDAAEARGRAEVVAKVEALAAAQEASSARWTEAIGEADNNTDRGYASGRAHAAEQAALRLRALIAEDGPVNDHGACFDVFHGVIDPPLVCTLPADHRGSHRADDGAQWAEVVANVLPASRRNEPATDDERSALMLDGLWDDSDYPEHSHADVLHAYRLGYEDGSW